MSSDLKFRFLIIVLLTLVGAYFAAPIPNKPLFRAEQPFEGKDIKLGLDLQGGVEMTLVVDPTQEDRKERPDIRRPQRSIASLAEEVRSVIERRINNKGLKEPLIRLQGADKILIQLPGIDAGEVDRVKKLLQSAGRLELRLVAQERVMEDSHYPDAPPGMEWLENADPKSREQRPHLLCTLPSPDDVTGSDIERADPDMDFDEAFRREGHTSYCINFQLSTLAGRRFGNMTAANVERKLAVVLDGRVMSAPVIREPIMGGGVKISGDFSESQARDLAMILRSGSLPCRVAIEGQGAVRYIAATLGADSIRRGALACALAFAAVALFMLVYYRGCGVIAVFALVLNFIYLLGLMALLSATLTLPGIAGLILTMGMAVDGNILVFERIREEIDKGKTPAQAFEAGHERAFVTIVDSNLTTLAAGIILFFFGSGPVQGFAVTMSVGILTTLFTVLFCSKVFLRWAMAIGWLRTFSMMRMLTKPSIPFTRLFRTCTALSLTAITVGIVCMGARGEENFGVDFRGGTIVQPRFVKQMSAGEASAKLAALTVADAQGRPRAKYPDLNIIAVASTGEGKSDAGGGFGLAASREIQILTGETYPGLVSETIDVAPSGQAPDPFHRGLRLTFVPARPATADEARKALEEPLKDVEGEKPQVEILEAAGRLPRSVAVKLTPRQAERRADVEKALRKSLGVVNSLRDDVIELFGPFLEKTPFENERPATDNSRDPFYGGKTVTLNLQEPAPASAVEGVLHEIFAGMPNLNDVYKVQPVGSAGDAPAAAMDLSLSPAAWARFDDVKTALKEAARKNPPRFLPANGPFQKEDVVGAAVAEDAKWDAVIASVLSWAVMILYLAARFQWTWLYGIAAVVALVHDVIISLGAVALCGLVVPKSWGLHFEFTLQTLAAALTIIGYSVNDTIVVFDRIRENRNLMRREPLRAIVDQSVNQTLSRTILTSLTVFLVVTLLYGVTMHSSGGIAEFAFPMIVGVVVGTYSSIYIAAPILLIGRREEAAPRPSAPAAVS